MKPIKMLGLAALAALMAMAFLGTGSAMAESTALCEEDEESCAAPVTHVHEATLNGTQAKLLSSVLNVECDALFLGDALSELGEPLVIHGAFTYSNCNNSCTATEENGPAEIKVLKEGHELAKVTGEGLVHLVCSGFINCRYNGVGLEGHGLGPLLSSETNGSVTLSEKAANKESGTFCPSTAALDSTTTPLEATYVTGTNSPPAEPEPTSLCSEDPGEGPEEECPEGQLVEHVHESTLAGAKAKLLSSILNVECDVLFLGDALSELGEPLVIHGAFTYSNCNNSCTATEENGPAEIKVSKEGHELAKVTGEGLVHLVCSGFINCRYNGVGLEGHGLGPLLSSETNGSVTLSEKAANKESGTFCPSTAALDSTTTPLEATYVTGTNSPPAEPEPTSLCSEDPGEGPEEECPEGQLVEHVHESTLAGAKAKLLSSILNVECDVLFLGDALSELGEPLVIHGAFTYSNCNNSCTATEENGPAEIKVSKEGHELAKVTGEGLVHLVCSGFINCRYNGVGLEGHGLGPLLSSETNGSVTLSEKAANKESGTFCPSTAALDSTTTPLEATYVTN